jgi:hypothetical protein
MTPREYLELAVEFDRAAQETPNRRSQIQLRELASAYMMLAKSAQVLERSLKFQQKLGPPG